jgi:hypothetical protein
VRLELTTCGKEFGVRGRTRNLLVLLDDSARSVPSSEDRLSHGCHTASDSVVSDTPRRRIASSSASTALSSMPGINEPYTSIVTLMLACPSRSAINLG